MAQEDQRYGRDKSTVVDKTYIDSGEYRRKFDRIVDNQKIARVLYSKAKEMLIHRSGTKIEDMYWIDSGTGEVVASVIDQSDAIKQKIIYTDSVKMAIEGRDNLITLHNHPSSFPPSPDDFNTSFQKKYCKSLVICHDGTIYQYESKQWIRESLYDMYVTKYEKVEKDEHKAQLMALSKIKENHKIDFWEVV